MTEKIARRGIKTPHSFQPDILEEVIVKDVIGEIGFVLNEENEIGEARQWLEQEAGLKYNYYIIVGADNTLSGIVSSSNLYSLQHDTKQKVSTLIRRKSVSVGMTDTLKTAVELMVKENIDVLPVVSEDQQLTGVLDYSNILSAYKIDMDKYRRSPPHISMKKQSLRILIRGQKLVNYR